MSRTLNILWWIFTSNCYPQCIPFQSLRWRSCVCITLVCWRLCVRFQTAKTQTLNPDFHSVSLVNRYERQSPRRWVSRECNNKCEWGPNIDHTSVRKTLKYLKKQTNKQINIYYYNSNLIRSAGSRQVDRHGSADQTRRGASSLI